MMDQPALQTLLNQLIATWENEVVEFKRAGKDFDTSKIGEYVSALANEANLRGIERAWLVFGVDNKTRTVVGTDYREQAERLDSLKGQIAQGTEPSLTFRAIHELQTESGRVILFEIPAAPRGMPIAWNGYCHGRAGESLVALSVTKQDEIRNQTLSTDWSAQVVAGATIEDLDEEAVRKARELFARKHESRIPAKDVMAWPLETFLDRARLTQGGKITRTALLLLGKPESAYHLSPHPAHLTWKLQDGAEQAYAHFSPPFLLATSALYNKIRNYQIRLLPDDSLLPIEIAKYDQEIMLEALHNCIAHQDYRRSARIVVTEYPDKVVFVNDGSFVDGSPADYLQGDKTPRYYRNPFLVQAMVELNMIDTIGSGISKMHKRQIARYLPLPDYDLTEEGAVSITIYGTELNKDYSKLLMQHTGLTLADVIALDRVQKRLPLDYFVTKRMRKEGLVEGHKPNLHISAFVASEISRKAEYIHMRAQDDTFYNQLILDYLKRFKVANREDLEKLLMGKLSSGLTDKQKGYKIGNLLSGLRNSGKILNTGSRRASQWKLNE